GGVAGRSAGREAETGRGAGRRYPPARAAGDRGQHRRVRGDQGDGPQAAPGSGRQRRFRARQTVDRAGVPPRGAVSQRSPAAAGRPGPGPAGTAGRSSGGLPAIWNLPPRNPGFVARVAELDQIRVSLVAGPVATVQAVHGMGGVGKTQTAIEYAYRNAAGYDLVWWVDAEKPGL